MSPLGSPAQSTFWRTEPWARSMTRAAANQSAPCSSRMETWSWLSGRSRTSRFASTDHEAGVTVRMPSRGTGSAMMQFRHAKDVWPFACRWNTNPECG